MKVELVIFNKIFLNLSWKWLNDPEIKTLQQAPNFTKEEQAIFYDSLEKRKDIKIFGVKYDDEEIGVAGLKNIINFEAEYFGYIGIKAFWGKGLGRIILNLILDTAKKMHLKRIYLKVSKNNVRATKLYLTSHFKIYSEDENNFFMEYLIDDFNN